MLRDYKRTHAAGYGIECMGIFGSVARNEQKEDSDIDIYYEEPSMGLKSLVRLPRELEDVLGIPVDIIRRHNNLPSHFVERIMKDIIYV